MHYLGLFRELQRLFTSVFQNGSLSLESNGPAFQSAVVCAHRWLYDTGYGGYLDSYSVTMSEEQWRNSVVVEDMRVQSVRGVAVDVPHTLATHTICTSWKAIASGSSGTKTVWD